ncbi:MAG: Gfo/Idh/MocA family oxidoreductase [Clostridia bacterium]|nr:Gfo/Idh/MocA family oxidoreductase [Clostridia bacterium]
MKKALLVGCGGYGAGYVEEILKSGNKLGLALSGIVDPYAEQSRVCGLIRENRIPVYRDVPAYYRENRADVAVVSTPIPLHRRQAEEVMRNGSDLLLEKPIAGSSADAEAILRTRDETGRKLTVGFQWCFNPEMLRLKKDADEGLFGRLLSMKALVLWPRDFAYFNRGTRWAGTKYAPDGTAVFDSIASNAAAHYLFNMLWMARRGYGASEARLTGFFAARANDVETFDTIALQAETEKGVPLFFAASHAVKNEERQDPVFVYRFEKATVTFGELPDRPTALLAHYGDGRTVDYGDSDNNGLAQKLAPALACFEGGENFCPGEAALKHVLLLEEMWKDRSDMPRFRPETIERTPEMVSVRGLAGLLRDAYEKAALPERDAWPV